MARTWWLGLIAGPPQFGSPTHAVKVSNDGLVYVADRIAIHSHGDLGSPLRAGQNPDGVTLRQARRLFNLSMDACEIAMAALVDAGFLVQSRDGAFARRSAVGRSRSLSARSLSSTM